MTWIKFNTTQTVLRCAAVFAAHFVCAGSLAAQDVVFRSVDEGVAVSGRFVAFDGENATVATAAGLVTFRAVGMTCDSANCPDLVEYVPSCPLYASDAADEEALV